MQTEFRDDSLLVHHLIAKESVMHKSIGHFVGAVALSLATLGSSGRAQTDFALHVADG